MKWHMLWTAAVLGAAASSIGRAAETIRIVEDGKPRAVVALAQGCDPQTRQAAELLAEYVERASGAKLPVVEGSLQPEADRSATIHVGRSQYVDGLGLEIDELDDDGFVIRGVDAVNLVIAGPTPWGTEFGVCEFLERYLGVRWLMPGPHGDDVPACSTIDVPVGEIRQEPVFFSRLLSGLQGGAQATWARRNRMHGRVAFHHNLHRLFPPETYTKTTSPEAAHTGQQGVVCKGMKRGGPHQTVAITPGRYAATAFVRVPQVPKRRTRPAAFSRRSRTVALPTISALSYGMRQTRNDQSRQSSHARNLPNRSQASPLREFLLVSGFYCLRPPSGESRILQATSLSNGGTGTRIFPAGVAASLCSKTVPW